LERYRDLLKPHGKLITVIDESVLNTATEKEFRDFIRDNFVVKAVISLPRNAFVNADTTVKTSILYLIKKEKQGETQPDVFMAISKNIGHNDAGKKTPELNDLPKILEEFRRWERA
jgi:type I restriction enzyme M protein